MTSFIGLLNNGILLLALGVIYDSLGLHNLHNRILRNILTGFLIGVVGISVMLSPWELMPGVFFDTRWVLMSLSGLYFGLTPTAIAVAMTVSLRIYQGGEGIFVGSLVIFVSAGIGLAFRYWSLNKSKPMGWVELYVMGVVVQLAIIGCMFFMPAELRFTIIKHIALPLLVLYPIGTMLLGMLLQRQRDRRTSDNQLLEHKELLDRERSLLKGLIDSVPDLIFYKSAEGNYLGCNKAFESFVGHSEGYIRGKTDYDLFDQDVADFFRDKDRTMMELGATQANDEWVTYPSGERVLLNTIKTPFYGEAGQVYGLVGISRDLTEKNRIEEQLKNSETTYRAVLSTALDGFWIVGLDGKILDVNEAYCKLSGFAEDEIVGFSVNGFDALEATEETLSRIEEIKKKGKLLFKTQHRHRDGHLIDVEINVSYWKEGERFFVFIRNITEQERARKMLVESESRFRSIFEKVPTVAVQGYDRYRNVLYWNQASEALYGYTEDEARGRKLEDLIIPDELKPQVVSEVDDWIAGVPVAEPSEMVLKRADGAPVSVFSSHLMLTGLDGHPEFYCVDLDLTDLKHAEERVVTLSQALEQSPVSVILTDTHGVIEYVNSTFERVTGYTSKEVIGQSTRILKSGMTPKSRYQDLWQTITRGEIWEGELQNATKSGEVFWEHASISPVKNSQGQVSHYLAVKQDITQNKAQEEKILHQAHFDSLTSLPNRFLSLDRLNQMIKEARRGKYKVAVLFMDLDDFKKVNDTLGHQAGDELLKEAAARLESAVREVDVVGRLGGDEFIILANQLVDSAIAGQIAEKVLDAFREPFRLSGRELVSTISIGISVYPNDGEEPSEMLRQADSAMYHSKEQGRNTYNFFTEQMNRDVERRLYLEEQLRTALDNQELEVYFQPLIKMDERRIVGAEALLRWDHQPMGMISPDEFIPIAEQTGLIVPIGRFVLENAIAQASRWRCECQDAFRIAINVSPRQFRDSELLPFVQLLMDQYELPYSSLELEITEGVLMSGHSSVENILKGLNELGIAISMDDFGTGYSSLSYLRSYPFDTLKVDKSFVQDITLDPADLELVGAAIAMGQGLGIDVIAEGIETEEQYQLLTTLGCDYGQGYLFGKPVPADVFESLLKEEGC